ncbi:SDR family oxidoreductase [Stappia sp.]|uniref:SDR family NAD(P)-dependent oxidoreductase n=1 Tax=Stappia sp. TaxID=1870903 RepID=UPI0032D9A4A2
MYHQFSVTGLSVIVTGAARGNGRAIADGFRTAGARVFAVDKLQEPLSEISSDPNVVTDVADLRQPESTDRIVKEALKAFERIDVLVNNAGVSLSAPSPYADSVWEETIAVNLSAPFRLARAIAPIMADHGGGSIINITSLGAMRGFPDNPSYQAAKAGLGQLTRALARDYGNRNVRANNLCPGYIHTDMTARSHADPASHADRLGRMMLPRWGEPADLVGPCLFLASPASSYVTGIDLPVDGGWLAKGL